MTQNTLLNAATTYTPTVNKTKNIAELGTVPLNLQIEDDVIVDKKTNLSKTQKVAIYKGEKYRIPAPVLEQIQNIVKVATTYGKTVELVKITRTGTTPADTRYKVEPVL